MAGRFPEGSKRPQVAAQMEAVFVQNLKYAADVFSEVGDFSHNEPTLRGFYRKSIWRKQVNVFECITVFRS